MTLSDLRPVRRALPLALALACASIALPAAARRGVGAVREVLRTDE